MSDNRRRIAALRAKAASTTFPAEAASLRAKADELEGKQPPRVAEPFQRAFLNQPASGPVFENVHFATNTGTGIFFEQMGGVVITFNTTGQGDTYWITVK